jgi:hypothetical protein
MHRLARGIGIALLLGQILAIGYARFVPSRYFCWAPFDTQTDYELTVALQGRELTPAEIRERYRRPPKGTDNRSPQHVIDILEGVERRKPRDEQAEITMRYRVNGKPQQDWTWTPPR